jgi:glycosyltransferase involved in cell wall biosynthesis
VRRRLLLVINGTDFGGTETALLQLAVRLQARGHEVEVLSIKRPGRIAAQLEAAGVPVATLDMADADSLAQLARGTLALWRRIRGRRVDVVQSFLPRANVMSRVANRFGARARHVSCERSTDFNRSRQVQRLNRWTAPWTDRVLAVSSAVRDVVVHRDGLPEERVSVLGNGLDLDALDAVPRVDVRGELGLPPEALLLCSVGRLVRDKGHAYLLQAFAQGLERWPAAHLVLVGEGPEEARLRDDTSRLRLDGRVHFLGFREPVAAVLKGCDVFVLPSLEEGFPVTVLEAMACGLPVVASDVGGVADVVARGRTGLIVPAAERWDGGTRDAAHADGLAARPVEALRDALAALVADAPARVRMGRNGRRRVESHFSLDHVVTSLEALYRELCSARP